MRFKPLNATATAVFVPSLELRKNFIITLKWKNRPPFSLSSCDFVNNIPKLLNPYIVLYFFLLKGAHSLFLIIIQTEESTSRGI